MKRATKDSRWLPPPVEWDFRSITQTECRIACHWEYTRDIQNFLKASIRTPARATPAEPQKDSSSPQTPEGRTFRAIPGLGSESKLFPRAWRSLAADERARVLAAILPMPALQVRALADVLERAKWADRVGATGKYWNQGAYVIRPNFSAAGVEAVIKEFEGWARQEAKKYTRSPRAKAAGPPFDLLKWLAVDRIDVARSVAAITYEEARESLIEYRRENPCLDRNGVFPMYASQGAWSKAKRDAGEFRTRFLSDASLILGSQYSVF